MSDFTSNFWSGYVAAITLLSIFACLLLLFLTARKKVVSKGEDSTTGHVWDEDLTEANNPMPLWWMGLFVITIVFGPQMRRAAAGAPGLPVFTCRAKRRLAACAPPR